MENQPMPEQPMQPVQPAQPVQPMQQPEPMMQPAAAPSMGAAPTAKPKKKWVLPTIIGLSVAAIAAVVAIVLVVVLNGGKNLTCDFGSMGKLTIKYNDEKILDVTADGQLAQSMGGMTIDEMNQEYAQELKGRVTMEEYMSITGYMLNSMTFGMGQCTLNGNTITKPAKYDEIMGGGFDFDDTDYDYEDDSDYD
ncbi:MAG: hypothetical protein Q4B29_01830, partial [Candidatus Saccharibacteria bacterium]|nr:hypothetical protein [Candidatus Saccharibacteria bacterium]